MAFPVVNVSALFVGFSVFFNAFANFFVDCFSVKRTAVGKVGVRLLLGRNFIELLCFYAAFV
jgi:hypothetical protein